MSAADRIHAAQVAAAERDRPAAGHETRCAGPGPAEWGHRCTIVRSSGTPTPEPWLCFGHRPACRCHAQPCPHTRAIADDARNSRPIEPERFRSEPITCRPGERCEHM